MRLVIFTALVNLFVGHGFVGARELPEITNSIGIRMQRIPAGTFVRGQGRTAHEVTLSQSFYLGVTEVTNAQWQAVMGSVPSEWKDADRPVEQVSWHDAVSFCEKLSAMPGERAAGRAYRLPTEAELEYSCRAGSTTAYSFGDDESRLDDFGWFDRNSNSQTHPVGQKRPNAWGLYDMHGNVYEWCGDWYGEYAGGSVTNPQGPSQGSFRVIWGGCWYSTARYCQSVGRHGFDPSSGYDILGFRLAMNPSGAKPPEAGQ